ncbi:MAG: HIT family protein [Deltaproteobacteria bacterium]|nr:HIT family protein [Deltaproteobacteria bacterium]
MEPCTFCRVVSGELEAYRVLEDDVCVAFLDHSPLRPGHCLLVPRQHYQTLPDLPRTIVGPLFVKAQLLAQAVVSAAGAEGSFVAINNRVSQSVPHLHVHVVPRRKGDGLKGFFWPRVRYPSEAAAREMQRAIREAIDQLRL